MILTGKLTVNEKIKTRQTHFHVCLASLYEEKCKNKETESIHAFSNKQQDEICQKENKKMLSNTLRLNF